MLGTHVFFLWSVRGQIARGDPDFTAFYAAGKIVREGRGAQLFDARTQQTVQQEFATNSEIRRGPLPYVHPPFEALLFIPLTFLSYRTAFALWNLLNLGMLFLVFSLLRSYLNSLRRISLWELVLASLAFFPVFANFHQGHDAILLLLVLVLSFRAFDKESDFVAGAWLGVGIFKYHLILPLVLILAVWKGRKLLLGFAATAAAATLVSLGMVGWNGALQYPAFVLRVLSLPGFGGLPPRQSLSLMGLLTGWPKLENAGWPLRLAVLGCSAGLLIVVARLRCRANDRRLLNLRLFNLGVACAVIAALLVGYSTNTYDLSLLILPLALVAEYSQGDMCRNTAANRMLILPVVPLLVSPLWFFLWMRWERMNLMAVFLLWWLYAIRREILRMDVNGGEPHTESPLT